ncbi:hypothetical protein OO256_10110, partial [Pseudomonas sp. DCB_CB]|uniref:hypothetical protein n=1 Tax=unclassified Pseudomonas TaxID=196821 RepID=UPI0022494F89
RLALPGQPPFLFQNVSVAAELKPYTSCLLRDSAARKGWVISYKATAQAFHILRKAVAPACINRS